MINQSVGRIRRGTGRVVRLSLWMLFISLSACTVLLFSTTGGSVPAAFRSWAELGCVSPESESTEGSDIVCMSQCGRFYLTATRIGNAKAPEPTYTVCKWADGEPICTLQLHSMQPTKLVVSSDGAFIAINNSQENGSDSYLIFDASDGSMQAAFPRLIDRLNFSPDSKSFVYSKGRMIHVESCSPRTRIRTLALEGERVVAEVYFNSEGKPKALSFQRDDDSQGAEGWDILSGRRDWRVEGLRAIPLLRAPIHFAFPAIPEASSGSIEYFSLADGNRIPINSEAPQQRPGTFSYDGRFLVYPSFHAASVDRFLSNEKAWEWRQQLFRLSKTFPIFRPSLDWNVIDSKTGITFPALTHASISSAAFIHSQNFGLTTFHYDGVYEWDLPPRQRWFTPWAWASLAATVGMGYWLWSKRRRTKKPAMSLNVVKAS
ncbi:hypothetical protein BH10PLA2_BH10PLA2_02930 [soil metagenome]